MFIVLQFIKQCSITILDKTQVYNVTSLNYKQ